MDTFDCIATKLETRQFDAGKAVQSSVKTKVLEAARLTGSSMNTQHWRFILVQDKANLERLARDSTTGGWVSGANFAVIVLTNPKVSGHMIDAGRAVQDMQLAAWNYGVGSGIFTGVKADNLRKDFGIPDDLKPTVCLGFGYPAKNITGKKKNRNPLTDLAFMERYGNKFEPSLLLE
jgi:nitroreductase